MFERSAKSFGLLVVCLFALVACSGTDGDPEASDESEENPVEGEAQTELACDFSSQESAECPQGMVCTYEHLEGRVSTENTSCHQLCQSDDDCSAERPNCSPEIEWGSRVCSQADYRPRSCDPEATGDECECGISDDQAFLVEGTGEDCEIIEAEVTACFEQANTCLNDCVPEFYRYDLGNGQAIIAMGLQGWISSGWESNGQASVTPDSCPAIELSEQG